MPQDHVYRKQNQDYLKLILKYSETISKRKLFMLDKDRKKKSTNAAVTKS